MSRIYSCCIELAVESSIVRDIILCLKEHVSGIIAIAYSRHNFTYSIKVIFIFIVFILAMVLKSVFENKCFIVNY
jgi:hypothetical protein